MTVHTRAAFLAVHAESQHQLTALLNGLADDVNDLVAAAALRFPDRLADPPEDGGAPLAESAIPWLRPRLNALVRQTFLGPDSSGQWAPFEATGTTVIPLSPYTRIFWPLMSQVARLAIEDQRQRLAKMLPADLWALYEPFFNGATSPVVQEMTHYTREHTRVTLVSEVAPEDWPKTIFPIAAYDPEHRFADPNSYRLSDRIWRVENEFRQRLDAYMTKAIQLGKRSEQITREVQQFLNPGQYLPISNKPYGRNVSYNCMRLARTEISAAYHGSNMTAARANPAIKEYETVRSKVGVPCPICDPICESSPYPMNSDEGVPPLHPNCLCGQRWVMVENTEEVIDRLRAAIKDEFPDKFGPDGNLGLAEKVRVNTFKWEPGEIGVIDAALKRSVLEAIAELPPSPIKSALKQASTGTFSGDVFTPTWAENADNINQGITAAEDYLNTSYSFQVPETGWLRNIKYVETDFKTPNAKQLLMQFHVDDLKLASWDEAKLAYDEAAARATQLWDELYPGRGIWTVKSSTEFETVVYQQMREVMLERGFDAVVSQDNQITIFNEAKLQFKRLWSGAELNPRLRTPTGIAEAFQGASERFEAVHTFMDNYFDEMDLIDSRRSTLEPLLKNATTQYYDTVDMMFAAPEGSQQRNLLSQAIEEFDRNIKNMENELEDLLRQYQTMRENITAELRAVLPTGPLPEMSFSYDYAAFDEGDIGRRYDEALRWMRQMTNGDIYDSSYTIGVRKIEGRAFTIRNDIYMDPADPVGTIIHEMGHALEDLDPHTHLRCSQFLQWKATDSNTFWLGDSYKLDEIAVPGRFVSPYVGKVYGSLSDPKATEVMSMGLQYVFEDPIRLYRDYTDHFDLIIGLLAGWL